ncbi:MAG: protein kinase, partial [Polyangiaceae bacterium]|nr:protein kinase [Polyangiaceae bacterium]
MPPKPPAQLADFEILRRLGVGGMAEVFLAKKRGAEGTYKLLVVKRILPAHGSSRRFRTMFVEEAHLATRLNHPNIVQVYEFSDHGDEGLLLSMEYVEGFDLAKLMNAAKQKGVQIPPYVAAFIVSEAAKGLHYAHERKDEGGMPLAIVHRDVSPQNILLSCEGVVKIADFGIASATMFHEEEGVIKGKFNYMSPEQARGEKVDRRSDIFALGVVFYELLTLRSPYGKLDDDRLLEAVRRGAFEPPSTHAPNAPPELEAIVLRAMAHSAPDRFQSGRDMAAAIARVLLEKQELIDNTSVESILLDLLGRVPLSQSAPPVAVKQAETLAEVKKKKAAPAGDGREGEIEPVVRTGPGPRIVREVRHVAVVTLRIKGLEELERVQGRLAAKRSADSIRQTLENIAYKRGAIWSWEVPASGLPASANAVVGLLANPARAAADAASLAIDTHEALAGASEDLPVGLKAAISIVRGIASGERDSRGHLINHSMQGSVSEIAQQLGACTPFGTTWVSGGVYRLVRRDFRWGDAPSLDIAGAAELGVPPQMRVYTLERPLTREERAAEIAVMPNDLVGRDAEKADLHAAYHRALTPAVNVLPPGQLATMPPPGEAMQDRSRGEVVTRAVVGEMGIGKTALVSSFLSEVPTVARTVRVECSPVKSELPLATVSDMLREITGLGLDNSIDEASNVLRGMLGAVSRGQMAPRMIARLAELVTGKNLKTNDDDAPSYRRDLVTVGFRTVLHALARVQPLIVVVDGLQWADRMSLDLLHDMLRRTDPLPILMLLVTRPEERISPYIEGFVRIELKGLTAEEQIRLVEARLGVRTGVPAVCSELVPRVAGNPFFLLENALLERGTLEIVEQPGGQHELIRHERSGERAEALPQTLEQLIGDRIRELPAMEHDIVDWLAVAGGPLDQSDLLALTRLPHDEAITRLCARGLCDRKGGLVDFRHPLARDVAYLALDAQARARMHRLLGEHLATTPLARGLSAAIVARHLARGDAPERAAHFYLEAAEAARSSHQSQLAQRYYQRALARLPPSDKRIFDAHQALEAIFRHLGRRRERRTHLLALRQLAKQSTKARWAA